MDTFLLSMKYGFIALTLVVVLRGLLWVFGMETEIGHSGMRWLRALKARPMRIVKWLLLAGLLTGMCMLADFILHSPHWMARDMRMWLAGFSTLGKWFFMAASILGVNWLVYHFDSGNHEAVERVTKNGIVRMERMFPMSFAGICVLLFINLGFIFALYYQFPESTRERMRATLGVEAEKTPKSPLARP